MDCQETSKECHNNEYEITPTVIVEDAALTADIIMTSSNSVETEMHNHTSEAPASELLSHPVNSEPSASVTEEDVIMIEDNLETATLQNNSISKSAASSIVLAEDSLKPIKLSSADCASNLFEDSCEITVDSIKEDTNTNIGNTVPESKTNIESKESVSVKIVADADRIIFKINSNCKKSSETMESAKIDVKDSDSTIIKSSPVTVQSTVDNVNQKESESNSDDSKVASNVEIETLVANRNSDLIESLNNNVVDYSEMKDWSDTSDDNLDIPSSEPSKSANSIQNSNEINGNVPQCVQNEKSGTKKKSKKIQSKKSKEVTNFSFIIRPEPEESVIEVEDSSDAERNNAGVRVNSGFYIDTNFRSAQDNDSDLTEDSEEDSSSSEEEEASLDDAQEKDVSNAVEKETSTVKTVNDTSSNIVEEDDESSESECSESDVDEVVPVKKKAPTKVVNPSKYDHEILPNIQQLTISVDEELTQEFGYISSIVYHEVIVQSTVKNKFLDDGSVLFLDKGNTALGPAYIMGATDEPFYSVPFSSKEEIIKRGIKVNDMVYYAPETDHSTFLDLHDFMKDPGFDKIEVYGEDSESEEVFSDDEEESKFRESKQENGKKRGRPVAGQDVFILQSSKPINKNGRYNNQKNNNRKVDHSQKNPFMVVKNETASYRHQRNSFQSQQPRASHPPSHRPPFSNYPRPCNNFSPRPANYNGPPSNCPPTFANPPPHSYYGPQPFNYGPPPSNYGTQPSNYGPPPSNYCPSPSNYGPSPSNYGSAPPNYGPSSSYGPPPSNNIQYQPPYGNPGPPPSQNHNFTGPPQRFNRPPPIQWGAASDPQPHNHFMNHPPPNVSSMPPQFPPSLSFGHPPPPPPPGGANHRSRSPHPPSNRWGN